MGGCLDHIEVNFAHTAFEQPMTYSVGNVQRGARSMVQKKIKQAVQHASCFGNDSNNGC